MVCEFFMRKAILVLGVAIILMLLIAGSVDAYTYRYRQPHNYYTSFSGDSDNYFYYDNLYGGEIYLSLGDRNCYSCHHNRYYYDDDYRERVIGRAALDWTFRSYDARYNLAYGKTTGEAFTPSLNENVPLSNWRNKYSYDYRLDGRGLNENYYQPVFDSELGYYNWRY